MVRVSQYENDSRTLRCKLVGTEETLTIPSGTTAKVEGTKPSGKGFSYSCTLAGDEVTVTIKDQMTAESGRVHCEVVLQNGTARLGAGKFELEVDPAGLKAGTVTSSDTFDSIIRDEVRKCAEEQLIVLTVDTELSSESSAPVANSTLCNFFANALKGFASGAAVTVDDVSPVEHSPKVWVHGKNLLSDAVLVCHPEYADLYSSALSASVYSVKKGESYTLSFDTENTGKLMYVNPNSGFDYAQFTMDGKRHSFTKKLTKNINNSGEQLALLSVADTTAVECGNISNVQLEKGDTATAYEPWVDPKGFKVTDGKGNTYTPNTDGTVEGVTPTSPTMTLSLDKEGAIIDCEYNRDLTAAIERIEAALFN